MEMRVLSTSNSCIVVSSMLNDYRKDPVSEMEETLRRLSVQYDMFFKGSRPLPPTEDHKRFTRALREMTTGKIRDNTRRFRLNNLMNKYTLLQEIWGRKMREREEGPLDYRRRRQALESETPATPSDSGPQRPVTRETSDSYLKVSSTRDQEIEVLHERISAARAAVGAPELTFETFSSMIGRQLDELRAKYQADAIGFRVDVVDGKVKLKVKPIQE